MKYSLPNLSEEAAREMLETIRWPDGPACDLCDGRRVTLMRGGTTRPGLYNCKDCRKPFTVTKGTLFEGAHIPLSKWIAAFYLLCASRNGVSSHQFHRMLGITYKSAWLMTRRIRLAMKEGPLNLLLKGVVEADEAYGGGKSKDMRSVKRKAPSHPKNRFTESG
jgi:transposase-like protein